MRTARALMVMPFSRSRSIESSSCSDILRGSTVAVASSRRSESVDLPWSMWAMMQKLRIIAAWPGGGWGGTGSMWPDRITRAAVIREARWRRRAAHAKDGAEAPS